MYADTRLQYPLKRKGERGAGEWERISWDEAIAEITDTWKNLQGDFGPGAVGFLAGSGNVDSTVKTYADRLIACMGATVLHNCYDNTGVYCQYNHGALGATTTGGHNEYRDIVNAENIFVWGSNPSESFIVDYHSSPKPAKREPNLLSSIPFLPLRQLRRTSTFPSVPELMVF